MTLMIALLASADAASVTEFPPMLRGDFEVDYRGSYEFGGIEEGGQDFGRRLIHDEGIDYTLEFAPYTGIAVNLTLPTTVFLRHAYNGTSEMLFDPATGSGSYEFGDPVSGTTQFNAQGIDGVWIGAAFAPFSERYKRGHQVTWRLDARLRTGSKNTLWSAEGNGRGSAPGGTAFNLGAAFSADKQLTSPYLDFQYVHEGRTTVDIVDEDGNTWLTGAELKAPDTLNLVGGFQVVGFKEEDSMLAFDLNMNFGYVGWSDVPSGLYLPDVLDSSRNIVVSGGDYLTTGGGFGVNGHITKYAGVRTGFTANYILPHHLEHPYDVRTGATTFKLAWNVSIMGKLR
jgi:hypothetical protein